MDTKQINIVWCDDNIDTLYNSGMEVKFRNHKCYLLDKAKSSDELDRILKVREDIIDAVIVDFNLGKNTTTPDKESAGGFREIHGLPDKYKSIPFYLYSGRDRGFIEKKYKDFEFPMEGDYFFSENKNVSSKRNRYFQSDEIDNLLDMVEEEVSSIATPQYKVRQEYHEAFAAIEEFKLDPDAIIDALLINRKKLRELVNPLREVIKRMVSKMAVEGIIPPKYKDDLNGVNEILAGFDKENKKAYSGKDFMPMSLYHAFTQFLNYTRDNSEKNPMLEKDLDSSRDIYIAKALAIICLDVINWSHSFYRKYIENPPFEKIIVADEEKKAIVSYDNECIDKTLKIKQINIVWCDDNIDTLYNIGMEVKFRNHKCYLLDKAKSSDELGRILADRKDFIDAVIVDFNLGKNTTTPDKESAGGFRESHGLPDKYKSIPFYLYSGRDREFIERKYKDFEFSIEGDYFFSENKNVSSKRNRYFQSDEIDNLLDMVEEEVSSIATPQYRVRQEYYEAFSAIDALNLNPDVIIKVLLSDKNIGRKELLELANPLRKVIESMVSKMAVKGIIPIWFNDNLNGVPDLLSGNNNYFKSYYKEEYFMPESLRLAFKWFLDYTQDGSHYKNYLPVGFEEYLKSSRDIYIVKALAIICLDVIKWAHGFYGKCIEAPPFHSYELKVIGFDEKKRAIVSYDDESNNKIYVAQTKLEGILQVSTILEISVDDIKQYDKSTKFFCSKWKAQLNKPLIGTISEIRKNEAIMYYGKRNRKIFIQNRESKLQEGTTVEIDKISTMDPKFGDFYCSNYKIHNLIDG